MDEAVKDGVGEGGILELAVPVGDRQLRGDDHRAASEAVVEDLEEVAAGLVSADAVPASSDDVQAAAGIGLRYFSPAGPIRLDLAAPLNARSGDDPVAVYVSIGQAF